MTTTAGGHHRFDQPCPLMMRKGGCGQQFQGTKIHPITSVDRQRYANRLMQGRFATSTLRIVLHVVDHQRSGMQTFDRLSNRFGNRTVAASHFKSDLHHRAANAFPLTTLEVAYGLMQRRIDQLIHQRTHVVTPLTIVETAGWVLALRDAANARKKFTGRNPIGGIPTTMRNASEQVKRWL